MMTVGDRDLQAYREEMKVLTTPRKFWMEYGKIYQRRPRMRYRRRMEV